MATHLVQIFTKFTMFLHKIFCIMYKNWYTRKQRLKQSVLLKYPHQKAINFNHVLFRVVIISLTFASVLTSLPQNRFSFISQYAPSLITRSFVYQNNHNIHTFADKPCGVCDLKYVLYFTLKLTHCMVIEYRVMTVLYWYITVTS